MNNWCRVELRRGEEGMPGDLKSNWAMFRGALGNDWAVAAFLTRPPENVLYFSPLAAEFARAHYPQATACPPPRESAVDPYNSDQRARGACFPQT